VNYAVPVAVFIQKTVFHNMLSSILTDYRRYGLIPPCRDFVPNYGTQYLRNSSNNIHSSQAVSKDIPGLSSPLWFPDVSGLIHERLIIRLTTSGFDGLFPPDSSFVPHELRMTNENVVARTTQEDEAITTMHLKYPTPSYSNSRYGLIPTCRDFVPNYGTQYLRNSSNNIRSS
jgi:hypothetical protein